MMFVGIDPARALVLGQQMRAAGRRCDDVSADTEAALQLSGLTSGVAARLSIEALDLEQVGIVLGSRAQLADGLPLDLDIVADRLGIDRDRFRQAVDQLQDPDGDPDATPLLDLVARDRVLFTELPRTLRDVADNARLVAQRLPVDLLPFLPEEGVDPELDAALRRFDAGMLPRILNGEDINADSLTPAQQRDLLIIVRALGGDEVFVKVRELRRYRREQGDNELRVQTVSIPVTEADTATMLDFVSRNVSQGQIDVAALDPGQQRGTDPSDIESGESGGNDGRSNPDTGGEEDDRPQRDEDRALDRVGDAVDSSGQSSSAVRNNFDGSFDVEFTDKETGVSYTGTYTETEDGYSVDVDYDDPTGPPGSVETTVGPDGATRTQTYDSGAVRTETFDRNGVRTSHTISKPEPPPTEDERKDEGGENNGIGGFDPTDVDGDGIDDRSDPEDNSGDPNGGFDGAV